MKKPILAALALCYALGAAAQTPDTAAPEGYRFTDVKILPVTPVKDQSRSGTCPSADRPTPCCTASRRTASSPRRSIRD